MPMLATLTTDWIGAVGTVATVAIGILAIRTQQQQPRPPYSPAPEPQPASPPLTSTLEPVDALEARFLALEEKHAAANRAFQLKHRTEFRAWTRKFLFESVCGLVISFAVVVYQIGFGPDLVTRYQLFLTQMSMLAVCLWSALLFRAMELYGQAHAPD